jgi:hypothetical protein
MNLNQIIRFTKRKYAMLDEPTAGQSQLDIVEANEYFSLYHADGGTGQELIMLLPLGRAAACFNSTAAEERFQLLQASQIDRLITPFSVVESANHSWTLLMKAPDCKIKLSGSDLGAARPGLSEFLTAAVTITRVLDQLHQKKLVHGFTNGPIALTDEAKQERLEKRVGQLTVEVNRTGWVSFLPLPLHCRKECFFCIIREDHPDGAF